MDPQKNKQGQVNLYVYDPSSIKCYVGKVASQLCKEIDYPLHIRTINMGKCEAWVDLMAYITAFQNIRIAKEEGDIKKQPIYSVILVEYTSLCSSRVPDRPWSIRTKLFGFPEPSPVSIFDDECIKDLVKTCKTIEKNSVTFPPVILSGCHESETKQRDTEKKFRSWGIPDNWTIYLDEKDENERLEGLEFNINYFIRTFWETTVG